MHGSLDSYAPLMQLHQAVARVLADVGQAD